MTVLLTVVATAAVAFSIFIVLMCRKSTAVIIRRERSHAGVALTKSLSIGVAKEYIDDEQALELFAYWINLVRLSAGELRQCACGAALMEKEENKVEHEGIIHTDKWCDTV